MRGQAGIGYAARLMTDDAFYVRLRSGAVKGPFTANELRSSAAAGKLPEDVEISTDQVTWKPPRKIPALLMSQDERALRSDFQNRPARTAKGKGGAPVRSRFEARREQMRRDEWGGLEAERVAFNWGVVGGILMIAVAVGWFLWGLNEGYIYYYPPILAVLGIVAIFNGVSKKNYVGNRRGTSRARPHSRSRRRR